MANIALHPLVYQTVPKAKLYCRQQSSVTSFLTAALAIFQTSATFSVTAIKRDEMGALMN